MSTAEKKHTDRDLAKAQQAAFLAGVAARVGGSATVATISHYGVDSLTGGASNTAGAEAERRYPLPKTTRPRELTLHRDFGLVRFNNGCLECRSRYSSGFNPCPHCVIPQEDVEALVALKANPTEEVEC